LNVNIDITSEPQGRKGREETSDVLTKITFDVLASFAPGLF